MRFRKLQIAWSVGWGVIALLLVMLWVRSYWWWDSTTFIPEHSLASKEGKLLWDTPLAAIPRPGTAMPAALPPQSGIHSFRLDHIIIMPMDERVGFYRGRARSVPIWIAVVAAFGLGAVVWCPPRYSLRTMLVATALVAVALGVGVRWFRG
jgi:hypothetical protein